MAGSTAGQIDSALAVRAGGAQGTAEQHRAAEGRTQD